MQCPNCKSETDGRYCPKCGAPADGATCRACDAPLVRGARFCTQCGESVRASGAGALPWYIAGGAILALIIVLLLPALQSGPPAGQAPFAGVGTGTPPPLTGTPREQADRLFNRIMQERAEGNDQQAAFFLPMAIQAYQQAGQLDADGLYHLGLLQIAAGDAANARATAERILAAAPDHLLGLATAAEAALAAGDTAAARDYYTRFLDHYDAEQEKPLPEYQDHARVLPEYRQEARQLTGR